MRFPRATRLVLLFAREDDARRVLAVLPKRLGRYGLGVHAEKTRMVRFARPSRRRGPDRRGGPNGEGPGTLTFLGFTHYWGKSRRGAWVIKRRTSKQSFRRGLQAITEWLRKHRHEPIDEQHRMLSQKLRGHYAYFGMTGNADRLSEFRWRVRKLWYKWLNRRSQRRWLTWTRYVQLLQRCPLPPIVVVHSIYRRVAKPGT